ncbi:MAG: SCO1664 family protein [Chloroflexi bacterium]|nr:SCO1664 family protein [Chloroflexota bacterium]
MGISISIKEKYIQALGAGEISLKGEFVWGSNYTFLIQITHHGDLINAVYKPTKGERPLWDFPPLTLTKREVAAYIVSEALGWDLVPPTVYRQEAPYGPGSVQLYIEHDPEYHYFNFSESDRNLLRPVVVFDLLVNNADRKGSHLLFDNQHRLWAIDHGICFHVEDKLRTVIWDFAREPIPDALISDLTQFISRLAGNEQKEDIARLRRFLDKSEIRAMQRRAEQLIRQKIFPAPLGDRRQYPWPLI